MLAHLRVGACSHPFPALCNTWACRHKKARACGCRLPPTLPTLIQLKELPARLLLDCTTTSSAPMVGLMVCPQIGSSQSLQPPLIHSAPLLTPTCQPPAAMLYSHEVKLPQHVPWGVGPRSVVVAARDHRQKCMQYASRLAHIKKRTRLPHFLAILPQQLHWLCIWQLADLLALALCTAVC